MFRYIVFEDRIDKNDDGEEQVSIYALTIESEEQLSAEKVASLASESNDWEVHAFGEGHEGAVGTYTIEEENEAGETTCIAKQFEF